MVAYTDNYQSQVGSPVMVTWSAGYPVPFNTEQQSVNSTNGPAFSVLGQYWDNEFEGDYMPRAPGPPNFNSPTGPTDINWSWQNSAGTSYAKQASWKYGDPCNCWTYTSLGDQSAYDQTGLTDGTQYGTQIADCNSYGCSSWSGATNATTQVPAPSNLAGSAPDQSDVSVSWQNHATYATSLWANWWQYGYSSQWTAVQMGSTGTTSWTQSGLHPGTKYSYYTQACTAVTCSPWSNQIDVMTPLPAPSNLVLTGLSDTAASFSWQNNATNITSDTTIYLGWWQYNYSSQWTYVQVANTTTSSVQSILAGTHYAWQVVVCTPAYGCSSPTNMVDVQSPMPAPSPYVSGYTSSSVTLGWGNPASTTTGFYVERSYDGGPWSAEIWVGNVTSWTDTGLSAGTWYYVVSTCSSYVCSPWSNTVSQTIGGGAAPAMSPAAAGGGPAAPPARPTTRPTPPAAVKAKPEQPPPTPQPPVKARQDQQPAPRKELPITPVQYPAPPPPAAP